jgi:hypothetical protein
MVSGFRDVYHFQLSRQTSQSVRSDIPYSFHPTSDKFIWFAEQQFRRQRVTKSYSVPTDPLFPKQWNLLNTEEQYRGNDLRVEQAWLQGLTGCNITVSVVDDGNIYRLLNLL